jgi:hypothetical protein
MAIFIFYLFVHLILSARSLVQSFISFISSFNHSLIHLHFTPFVSSLLLHHGLVNTCPITITQLQLTGQKDALTSIHIQFIHSRHSYHSPVHRSPVHIRMILSSTHHTHSHTLVSSFIHSSHLHIHFIPRPSPFIRFCLVMVGDGDCFL